jgi:DNA processing protein
VAIVGSRRADPYGLEVAEQFACQLAVRGITVVSGLALGIDSAAHRGTLAAKGRTVAVLGCGIDSVYPRTNKRLAAEIAVKGTVLSEFPIGTPPHAWNFPIRNRIIAALCVGTLVVRATPRSGSLITVRHALDLGLDVYAVPGNIFDQRSVGPNTLIREGALCVQHPRDIVDSLPLEVQSRLRLPASETEAAPPVPARLKPLLESLPLDGVVPQDEVVSRSLLSIEDALSGLLELEMGGWIRRYPGPTYSRRSLAGGWGQW